MNDSEIAYNAHNYLPVFNSDPDVLDHERESIAVYDNTTKQMVSYNLISGWVEFATKVPLKNPESVQWVYLEEMATPNEESEIPSTSDATINNNNGVFIPELINPNN